VSGVGERGWGVIVCVEGEDQDRNPGEGRRTKKGGKGSSKQGLTLFVCKISIVFVFCKHRRYKSHLDVSRGAAAFHVRTDAPVSPGDPRVPWASERLEQESPATAPFDTRRRNVDREREVVQGNQIDVHSWDAGDGASGTSHYPGNNNSNSNNTNNNNNNNSQHQPQWSVRGTVGRDDAGAAQHLAAIAISPHQYSASSELCAAHRAAEAAATGAGWWPEEDKAGQFVQVDSASRAMDIAAVATLAGTSLRTGSTGQAQVWVTGFRIKTSEDRRSWTTYVARDGRDVLDGNVDESTWNFQVLDPPIRGVRYLRIYPVGWNSHIALRFQLLTRGA
jgi:hypothetical protein